MKTNCNPNVKVSLPKISRHHAQSQISVYTCLCKANSLIFSTDVLLMALQRAVKGSRHSLQFVLTAENQTASRQHCIYANGRSHISYCNVCACFICKDLLLENTMKYIFIDVINLNVVKVATKTYDILRKTAFKDPIHKLYTFTPFLGHIL